MESYTNFAEVYDTFMDRTSYEDWADQVEGLLKEYGISQKGGRAPEDLVADLGCGTGRLTEILAARGYRMLGIDLSPDMLNIALARKLEKGSSTVYVCQDMRDLDLGTGAGSFISVGDSINYLLTMEDLTAMFSCVRESLFPGGVYVFDFKTLHLYRDVIGDATIAEDREDCAFIWDNTFREEDRINEYDLCLYIADPSLGEGVYRKFEEFHYQRGYTLEEVREAALSAGLEWILERDPDRKGPADAMSERILAVCRKPESK